MTGTLVVKVEARHTVQLLAVVFVALQALVPADVAVGGTEGIIVDGLLKGAVMVDHGTVVTQMILGVIMENGLTAAEGGIAAIEQAL